MDEIREKLNEEIARQFDELSELEVGSDDYKAAEECLTKLTDRAIEMEKIRIDEADKAKDRIMRDDAECNKRKDDRKDRIVQYCLRGVEMTLPVIVAIWGTKVTLKYDKEGVLPTTLMGKGFINKLIPKK